MNIELIKELFDEISTNTGLSYSGDRTISKSEAESILDYITNLRQLFIKIAEYTDNLLKENKIYSEYGKKILEMCDIHDG